MTNQYNRALRQRKPRNVLLLLGVLFMLSTNGCAHTGQHNEFGRGGAAVLLPRLTTLTTGAIAVLLANGDAFSADFTMTLEDTSKRSVKISGQIFAHGGKLRLETAFDKSKRANKFGVIWDVAANQGYVFSEALQGYAPINELVHPTNLLTQSMDAQTDRLEGHLVNKANVTIMGSDGQSMTFQISRAQDMGNLPLKIESLDSPQPVTFVLSKVQLATPAEELFLPPDGFTKYENETAMLDELEVRQQSVFEGEHESGGDYNQSGGQRRSGNGPNAPP